MSFLMGFSSQPKKVVVSPFVFEIIVCWVSLFVLGFFLPSPHPFFLSFKVLPGGKLGKSKEAI